MSELSLKSPVLPAAEPTRLQGSNGGMQATILGSSDGNFPPEMLALVLDAITDSAPFKRHVLKAISEQGLTFSSYPELLAFLQSFVFDLVREIDGDFEFDPFEIHEALSAYKRRVNESLDAYDIKTKPNPDAVFWPNPKRDPSQSIYDTLPLVRNLGLITKDTPVGSAGSCFAFEFARNLQKRGFNYVVTETEAEDAAAGVYVDGYNPQNPHARFSANYGILFNTPSFRQLAEKAFNVRRPRRILVPSHLQVSKTEKIPIYVDPFRENVYFRTPEAYEANYEKHMNAIREAFLRSEFFVVTLGLNECWEFVPDGSVLSRNPRELDLYPLIRRRVLNVEENVANIQTLIDIVREHNPDFKLIISVSPIPFLATTRAHEQHVVVANAHSKAVLRVAAEELVRTNRDVFYFPSYELVTVCTRDPWSPDGRHVTEETVERVMQLFDAQFVH